MNTWLHFIGRSYYSQARFIKEAVRYGITRRVSLRQLESMAFGDRVLLAMVDGKSSAVFGSFIITTLSGLSAAAAKRVRDELGGEQVSAGGLAVERGCGSYIEGATWAVDATLQQLLAILKELDEPGKLMVGGAFEQTPSPAVRLKDVRHMMGFRRFDFGGFLAELASADPKRPALRGHFYADKVTQQVQLDAERHARMQIVEGYKRKEELDENEGTDE